MTDPIQKLIDESEIQARDRCDCDCQACGHCEAERPIRNPGPILPWGDPTPMAGGTPDAFEAGEPPSEPQPEMLAAEACIRHLSREPGFASWWSTLGGSGQAFYHDAMGDLIRARMVDSDGDLR